MTTTSAYPLPASGSGSAGSRWRQRLQSRAGQVVLAIVTIGLVIAAIAAVRSFFGGELPDSAYSRMYICTETGKPFRHQNKLGEGMPVHSPFSGKDTGVPAEACYWTADGQAKKEPTWVLLNSLTGQAEPTFCPDCGRLVVGHNPQPGPDAKVPPTQEEYAQRRASRAAARSREEDR